MNGIGNYGGFDILLLRSISVFRYDLGFSDLGNSFRQ